MTSDLLRPRPAKALWLVAVLAGSTPALAQTVPDDPARAPQTVDATIVEGEQRPPVVARPTPVLVRGGDIALNFPEADVRVVAEAVLGDLLDIDYTIAPGVSGPVTVVTARPISRDSVLPFLEDSFAIGGFALVLENGRARIERIAQGVSGGIASPDTPGFGTELLQLQFVSADQMRALIAPILPNVVSVSDPARNILLLRGTSGQRASARELLQQFDVNWLRNMSFALFVPKRTDARVIVPELEKLINAPDSPTRDLVRIIAMEKLNGVLAISRQRQYLDDVNRWIEILDRQGQNNEPRLFVYKVQNSRSRDLARTLNRAFGRSAGSDDAVEQQQAAFADSGAPDGAAAGNGRGGNAAPQGGFTDGYSFAPGASTATSASRSPSGAGAFDDSDSNSNTSFGAGGVQISSDDTNNAILVYGTPREYAVIEDALRKLDVPPMQVMIEAAITEVSLTDDLRYGLQWNFIEGNENAVLTDSTTGTGLVRDVPGFSFLFGNSGSLTGVLNALEGKTKVNVVSAPKLMVINNQTASLQVGNQVPVLTQNSTGTIDPNAPVINAIEYRDTGVILKITPRVNGSGLVLLDISQEVSDVLSARAAASGIDSPTISTRRVSTTVAVQDGQVLALGGLIRNIQTRDKAGIPFLSQIPIIGGLFGRQVEATDKIELVILLKPRVIRTVDDARAITEELRSKIRSLEPFSSTGDIP
jgi:general secretion pathway protein D